MAETKPRKINRQSVTRLAAKQVARTTAKRAANDLLGGGIIGAIAGVLISSVVKQTDKVIYNKDFGVWQKK